MDKIQSKIGAICINFETLDLVLSATISRLVSDNAKIGAILTTELSFGSLVNCFSSLIKYQFSTDNNIISKANELIKVFNECQIKRNQIIHSTYYFKDFENNKNNVGRIKISSKQKHGLKIDNEVITEDDLKFINEQILLGIEQLQSLYSHLYQGEQIKYG